MKKVKKLAGILLAMIMMLSMCVTVFAAENYSITVEKSNKDSVSIEGNTYSAYKLFDVTYDDKGNYSYTVASEFAGFTYAEKSGKELIDLVGTLTKDSEALNTFAEAALKYATDNSVAAAGSATGTAEQKATISLNQPGYYLVSGTATAKDNQTVTAACALDTTNPTATVKVKADAPSVNKEIIVEDNKTTKNNNAAIGDQVDYKVTSKVPEMTGYEKYYFVVNDKMSKGLTFNDDIAITVGTKTLVKDTDFTVTTGKVGDDTAIEIVFKNFLQYRDSQPGAAITITYSATVNKDAVIGTAGNDNTVDLIYSNNPNTKDNGTPGNPDKPTPESPTGKTPESKTRTYVTELKLIKTDNEGNRLNGAEFDIEGTALNTTLVTEQVFKTAEDGTYYKLKDGTYTETAPVVEGDKRNSDSYDNTTQKYKLVPETKTVTKETAVKKRVVVNGEATITGLAAGEYTITETKAPAGYNLLKGSKKVTIGWTAPGNDSTECTWTYTGTDKQGEVCINELTIVNESGTQLPSTGGMGTTIFYVVGSLLVVGAAILLVTKKRMSVR